MRVGGPLPLYEAYARVRAGLSSVRSSRGRGSRAGALPTRPVLGVSSLLGAAFRC
jgi:hypothetical protein